MIKDAALWMRSLFLEHMHKDSIVISLPITLMIFYGVVSILKSIYRSIIIYNNHCNLVNYNQFINKFIENQDCIEY